MHRLVHCDCDVIDWISIGLRRGAAEDGKSLAIGRYHEPGGDPVDVGHADVGHAAAVHDLRQSELHQLP